LDIVAYSDERSAWEQLEPLCGSGRRSVPDWVTMQSINTIKLSLVGAGRARDDGAITLQSLCKYRGRGPLLRSVDALNLMAMMQSMGILSESYY